MRILLGAIAIDSDWNPELLQNSVEYMLYIDKFLANVDTEEKRPAKFKEENAVTTLKELGEHGTCSIAEYDMPEHQVEHNEHMWWACTCTVRSWNIRETAFATSKKKQKNMPPISCFVRDTVYRMNLMKATNKI